MYAIIMTIGVLWENCTLQFAKPEPLVFTEKIYVQKLPNNCSKKIIGMMNVIKIKISFYEVKRTKNHELGFSV
jgi:hypothetical protein